MLAACASGKAPGVDNIPYEAFCVDLPWVDGCDFAICGTLPIVFLHPILMETWNRRPLAKCTNSRTRDEYHPITLTCCFAKILDKLLLLRVHALIDPSLDECQAGFC